MKIITAERRRKKFAAILLWNGNMKKRTLIFDKHSHISTIRVKFQWTKHIRQLKPMKEILKNPQESFYSGEIKDFLLLIIKETWYELMMKWKQKVLKDSSPLIDGLLLSILMDTLWIKMLLKKVAKENMNSEMKIWKMNCWRKVPLEMLCLVDEWIKQIQSYTYPYARRIYWENQALTNQLINQTGTFGPVMLRRMKKID